MTVSGAKSAAKRTVPAPESVDGACRTKAIHPHSSFRDAYPQPHDGSQLFGCLIMGDFYDRTHAGHLHGERVAPTSAAGVRCPVRTMGQGARRLCRPRCRWTTGTAPASRQTQRAKGSTSTPSASSTATTSWSAMRTRSSAPRGCGRHGLRLRQRRTQYRRSEGRPQRRQGHRVRIA